jgi:cytochrome c556
MFRFNQKKVNSEVDELKKLLAITKGAKTSNKSISASFLKEDVDLMGNPNQPPAPEMGGEEAPAEEADPKKEFQEAVGKLGQTINDLQDNDQFDEKDIKNAMNSLISAIGSEGFKLVGDKVVESFYKKMQGSQENVDKGKEEEPIEEPAEEAPIEEPSTEKLDENFIKSLKLWNFVV